ncbi:MAG: 2-thiouracil desulfurase family protein, partial [Candidatus Poseidoniales archaeon]
MSSKPKLAVSSCLLGQRVRYNGDAAEFRTLTRVWGEYLDLVGVCPEVGI